jgi:hypothetical protein
MSTEIISSHKELNDWRQRIEAAWQKSVASVIEVGKLVKEAKQTLGVSYTLLETELPFSSSVAAFLVKIAENPVLSNPTYHARLPNSYNTLYHLAKVDEKQLVKQLEKGEITPNFTLNSAKALRDALPSKSTKAASLTKRKNTIEYEVGTLFLSSTETVDQFQNDLNKLLLKHSGYVNFTHKDTSLAEWHRTRYHKQACEQIRSSEKELKNISYDQLRMLEDAAHFLTKERNKKTKAELVIKGEIVERVCLPEDYKDIKKIRRLLGIEHVTRGQLKKWCIDNKVPNQFTDLASMDKQLYIWEQARLITEKKDVKGGMKRLNSLAARSTVPHIKKLAQVVLSEVTRFNN